MYILWKRYEIRLWHCLLGTPYCVEAVIGSTIKPGDKLLILSNGAYGDRMGNIAEYHGIDYDLLAFDETEQISVSYVDDYLAHNADITHVAIVHCETTTGILNPLLLT